MVGIEGGFSPSQVAKRQAGMAATWSIDAAAMARSLPAHSQSQTVEKMHVLQTVALLQEKLLPENKVPGISNPDASIVASSASSLLHRPRTKWLFREQMTYDQLVQNGTVTMENIQQEIPGEVMRYVEKGWLGKASKMAQSGEYTPAQKAITLAYIAREQGVKVAQKIEKEERKYQEKQQEEKKHLPTSAARRFIDHLTAEDEKYYPQKPLEKEKSGKGIRRVGRLLKRTLGAVGIFS